MITFKDVSKLKFSLFVSSSFPGFSSSCPLERESRNSGNEVVFGPAILSLRDLSVIYPALQCLAASYFVRSCPNMVNLRNSETKCVLISDELSCVSRF